MDITEAAPVRDSRTLKSEIAGLRRQLSEAAESHDSGAYDKAVLELRDRTRELETVAAQEITEAREAAMLNRQRAQFKEQTGFATPGELIAHQLTSDPKQRHQANAAKRTGQIAEAVFAVSPTPAEQAAEALARFRKQAQDLGGAA